MRERTRHERVRDAFHRVLDADAADRRSVFEEVLRTDPELRDEIESLLAHDGEGAALEDAARRLARDALELEGASPRTIGRYRLIRPLGAGSMGSVYLAERDTPRRTVAIKLLHRAIRSPRHRRRFEMESEILGRLDHPGIAGVLDAGCEDDRPYFVMEFVDGLALTSYAREHDLDRRRRVALLIDLCDAVAHAHQRGVVHRDLKPANVLVDRDGRVRVLDFGVARAVDGAARSAATDTLDGDLIGTLPYMSPEQLDGDPDIDVRADVYALGAVTFELLAGERAVDLEDLSLPDAVRRVRERAPRRLREALPSAPKDLDIIVHRAMASARGDRYPNVVELAADLRRWLDHEPILARPPRLGYQLRRFARRHRTLVTVTACCALLLLAATAGTTVALLEMFDQRRAAFEASTEAGLQRDAAQRIGDDMRRQRDAYLSVLALAETSPTRMAALADTLATDDERIDAILAHAFAARGRRVEALAHALRAIAHLDDRATVNLEAVHELLWLSIRIDTAAVYGDRRMRWLETSDAILRRNDPELAALLTSLDRQRPDLWTLDHDPAAVGRVLDAIERHTAAMADDSFDLQLAADRLVWHAEMFSGRRAHATAIEIIDTALRLRRRHLLETSPRLVRGRLTHLDILLAAGRHDETIEHAQQALRTLTPVLPDDHLAIGLIESRLGRATLRSGHPERAADILLSAFRIMQTGLPPTSLEFEWLCNDLVPALGESGRTEAQAEIAAATVRMRARSMHRRHWRSSRRCVELVQPGLAHAATRAMETTESDAVGARFAPLLDALDEAATTDPDAALVVINAVRGWIDVWVDRGGWTSASRPVLDAVLRHADALDASPLLRAELRMLAITHHARAGEFDAATRAYQEGIEITDEAGAELLWARTFLRLAWGRALLEHDRAEDALPVLRNAHDQLVRRGGENGYNTQFAGEAISVARHALHGPTRARADDAARLRDVAARAPGAARLASSAAWSVSRLPGHDDATNRLALTAAERADRALSGTWLAGRALAAAQYRCGRYEEAVDTVRRVHAQTSGERPALRAIEAMALHALGDPGATAVYDRARAMADTAEFRCAPETVALIDEAGRLLGRR